MYFLEFLKESLLRTLRRPSFLVRDYLIKARIYKQLFPPTGKVLLFIRVMKLRLFMENEAVLIGASSQQWNKSPYKQYVFLGHKIIVLEGWRVCLWREAVIPQS